MNPRPSAPEVNALRARLRHLEVETSGLLRQLREAPEAELAGPHLVLVAGRQELLLSASLVHEVVRVVSLQPVAGAAPAVAGSFICRGRSLFAVELGALLEHRAAVPAHLDAHLVLLGTAQPLALLVDRVKEVVTGVSLVSDDAGASPLQHEGLSPLMARVGAKVYPLLDAGQLSTWLESRVP